MPSLNFTVFIDKVESGFKRTTIRRKRKNPIIQQPLPLTIGQPDFQYQLKPQTKKAKS